MKKLSTIATGLAACLLLTGCGLTIGEDPERYALMESRIAELEAELQIAKANESATEDALNLGTEVSPASESFKTEQGIVMLTSVDPSPATEPDDYTLPYYSSIDELVELYRSGEWGEYQMRQRRGSNLFATMSCTGAIEEGSFEGYDYMGRSTGIYPDLPDGRTPDDYIDYLRDFWGNGWFYCLEADGVHAYGRGQEKAFYPVDSVTADSTMISLFRAGVCVVVDGRVIDCQTNKNGGLVLLEGVVGLQQYDGGSTEIITFQDGEIRLFANYRDEDRSYVIAKNATAATLTEHGFGVVFTDSDGYTHTVDLDDYDTRVSIKMGSADVLP